MGRHRRYRIKTICILILSFLCSALLQAQDAGTDLSSSLTAGKYRQPYRREFSLSPDSGLASARSTQRDTVRFNMYGMLREDNPQYNQRSPLWLCALSVLQNNIVTWGGDRYIFNQDFARIGFSSWKRNLKKGPVWDTDRFAMNYFFHPYSGLGYFNAARAHGYGFYESVPFAFAGSLMWEYFGENTLPAVNDLINTTVTGAFLGEVAYRLSSDFLDDRTTGSERVFRELFAAVICPTRAFSRLLQGRVSRVTSEEIYQKEPLNMTFTAGAHTVNHGRRFGTGSTSLTLTLHLDYGNLFERRSRKMFDYFKLRADVNFGVGRKIIDNIIGHGLLFGKNFQPGNADMLIGGFQHYDFWDNKTFELGSIAFGPGMISKLAISPNSNLYFDAHLGIVPLAGNSTRLGPDTSQYRDYNFGGGAEGKLETTLNLAGWVSVTFRGYYYWIRTYVGNAGNSFIGIIKPSVAFRLIGDVSLGFEQLVYFCDRYPRDFPEVHDVRTEQKVFLQLYIDNFKQQR
jgi:hypothetical protein